MKSVGKIRANEGDTLSRGPRHALGLTVPQPIFRESQAACKSRHMQVGQTTHPVHGSLSSGLGHLRCAILPGLPVTQRSSISSGELGQRSLSFPFQNHRLSFSFRSLGQCVQYNQPTKWRMSTEVSIREMRINFQTRVREPSETAAL